MASVYCLPSTLPWRHLFADPIQPFMKWSGLWQEWNMFSPNPDTVDAHFAAVIWYPGGESELFELPRMDKCGPIERIYKERWRKFLQDNLNSDDKKWMDPFFARYIAQSHDRPGHRPVAVELVKHYSIIAGSDTAFAGKTQRVWKDEYFYNYSVHPGDFPK